LALMDLIRELPDDIALREELGNVLVWQGDFKNAVRVFRELHESHPEDAGLKMSLGEALSWSGQCREALDIFGGLIDRGDSSDRAVKGFLDAYIADEVPSANHAHRVQWMYKRHTHMAKLPWDVAGVLASALVRAGHESEGIDLLKEVLLENPENRDVRLRLADALVAAGRSNEAHPHFRALLSDAQNDSK